MSKQVLVTGGAGFIGSHLVDALINKGYSVRVFDNLEPQVHAGGSLPTYFNSAAEFIYGDVRDKEALAKVLEGVDTVYHLAAMVGPAQSMHEIKKYTDVNIGGTANLLEALTTTKHQVEKVVLASSVSVYGEGVYRCEDCGRTHPTIRLEEQIKAGYWEFLCPQCGKELIPTPLKETAPLGGQSLYGISKQSQESMLLAVGRAYNIPVTALRYFNVFGPRQSLTNPNTAVFAVFSARLKEGKPPLIVEDGRQTRDFVYVADVVRATVAAGDPARANFEAINVGSGQPTSIYNVAQTLIRLNDLEGKIKPEVNLIFRKGDVRHCSADVAKAKKLLDWEPEVAFEEGLREAVAWARNEEAEDTFEGTLDTIAAQGLAVSSSIQPKIIFVGHTSKSYGPVQALPEYLAKNTTEFAVITHPFPYSEIRTSQCRLVREGKVIRKFEGPDYKSSDPVHFLGDTLLTFYFFLKLGKRWDLYIGADCLNTFFGLILRALGRVKKVVFYEIDYTPNRLKPELFNKIFHFFNGLAARQADMIWDNPPNLTKIRRRQGADLARITRVPNGIHLDQVKLPSPHEINRHTLVYVGHVTKSKGLQLVVEAIAAVAKKVPDVKVAIVGSGPYEQALKDLVKERQLEAQFEFFGFTQHDWTLNYLPSCGVALAPYLPEDGGTFQYADPLKVKDYLGCGLPIIITRVPSSAEEVDKKGLGLAIDYDQKELEEAMLKLLTDTVFWEKCRKNVLAYSTNIDWTYIYNRAFRETFFGLTHRRRSVFEKLIAGLIYDHVIYNPTVKKVIATFLKSPWLVENPLYLRFYNQFMVGRMKQFEKVPFRVMIENTNACDGGCVFCPHKNMQREVGVMSMDTYKKIIDECKELGIGYVTIYGFGEPLLDKQFLDKVRYAKAAGISRVTTNTNAMYLDEGVTRELLDSGLDEIYISFDAATEETYQKIRPGLDFKRVEKNILNLVAERKRKGLKRPGILLSFVETDSNRKEVKSYLEKWRDKVDGVSVSFIHNWTGEVDSGGMLRGGRRDPCRLLWTDMVISWNGDVPLCCNDYENRVILGNVEKESLRDIWGESGLAGIRKHHRNRSFGQVPLCKNCELNYHHKSPWWVAK